MVFSSLVFLFCYLTVTLALYFVCPRRWRNTILFIVSLLFYGYGEPVYILLMLASIAMNYVCGILIENRQRDGQSGKAILILNVALNLGLLGFFKYAGFVIDTLRLFPSLSFLETPLIPLPIGISFYTFQTMSYTIDVYRRETPAQRHFVTLGTYVSLFPQLIAGPIVRYVDVAEQLEHRRETPAQFTNGVKLFMVGLAKKVLIANPMGALWEILKPASDNGLVGAWIGIFAFTLQIYFDFSGYSDMARGLGNMFGFEFLKNFDYPYISKSITEFWRRWHMSLGTWFREYVYIPLGGNRCGKGRLIFNLFAVWALTGLWHGASWNFVLWGVYFGVILVLEKFFLLPLLKKAPAVLSHLYALFFIVMGWVIFDFTDLAAMGHYLVSLFTLQNGILGADTAVYVLSYLPLMLVAALVSTPLPKTLFLRLTNGKHGWLIETIVVTAVLLLCVASLVGDTYNAFLYFRF